VAHNLTLHELARRIGYSPQHISDAELAKNPVSEPFVAAVDRALGALGTGRERESHEARTALERTFDRLPRDVTRDTISSLGWGEERLHHTESYCAMFTGGGEQAREQALALYNGLVWRGPAQINLHRATSMIALGDAREGARRATAVLAPLSPAQRSNRLVRRLAVRTLATVPAKARREPAVADLRELLAAA
jgi:transcriptional regulator with XRE-family HTH domain